MQCARRVCALQSSSCPCSTSVGESWWLPLAGQGHTQMIAHVHKLSNRYLHVGVLGGNIKAFAVYEYMKYMYLEYSCNK